MPVAFSYQGIEHPKGRNMILTLTYDLAPDEPNGIGLGNNGEEDEDKAKRRIIGIPGVMEIERNRMIQRNYHNYIFVSFANLKYEDESDRKRYVDHIKSILAEGIKVADRTYLFCGHSNSQLKARTCFLYAASNHSAVSRMINTFGDFEEIQDVAKRSKRIGLLFSSAKHAINLYEHQFMEIDDVERNGRIFTDGCGFISKSFAQEISQRYYTKNVCKGVNVLYVPQVLQIRYKGYKGTLVVQKDEEMKRMAAETAARRSIFMKIYFWILTYIFCFKDEIKVIFRKSMKKFNKCEFDELFILEKAKPYGSAKLNGEIVSILSSLGIKDEVFIKKLREYFDYVWKAARSRDTAIHFMDYKGHYKVLRKLRNEHPLLEDLTPWIRTMIHGAQYDELKSCFDKKEVERVHIMIPKSRLLIGVCDISGKLNEGECYVRYTTDKKALTSAALKGPVIVGRNPCLHPSDIQIFIAVNGIVELEHLVDCIVFSVAGKLPAASQLSGGDLDGDKFFVCWDPDLLPEKCNEPLDYYSIQPKSSMPFSNKNKQLDLIDYFAKYNTTTLGKITSLYKEWIRVTLPVGASSPECVMLNELYCKCVDGEDVEIPVELLKPPELPPSARKPFILDILTKEIQALLGDRYHVIMEHGEKSSQDQEQAQRPQQSRRSHQQCPTSPQGFQPPQQLRMRRATYPTFNGGQRSSQVPGRALFNRIGSPNGAGLDYFCEVNNNNGYNGPR